MKKQSRVKPRCPMMFGRLHRDLIEMECLEEKCAWWGLCKRIGEIAMIYAKMLGQEAR